MNNGESVLSLRKAIQRSTQELDPHKAITDLLEDCIVLTGASRGCIYRLKLDQSEFLVEAQIGTFNELSNLSVNILEMGNLCNSLIECAISKKEVIFRENKLAAPILRGDACIGVLSLETGSGNVFTQREIDLASTIGAFLLFPIERTESLKALTELQRPLDYFQPWDLFVDEIIALAQKASSMPFVALREYDENDDCLHTLALAGFGITDNKEKWDLQPVSKYPTFEEVLITGEPIIEPDMNAEHLASLRAKEEIEEVKSFVAVPVLVGNITFGVLSFATRYKHPFSPLELAIFMTISNGIGVAITNHRNSQAAKASLLELARVNAIAVSVVNIEAAQAARHEARAHLNDCHLLIRQIHNWVERRGKGGAGSKSSKGTGPRKEDVQSLVESSKRLDEKLLSIHVALEKIKSVSRSSEGIQEKASIIKLWNEAFDLTIGGLNEYQIRPNINGPDVSVNVFSDKIRHAFVQLLLNSIEAFKERRIVHGRTISITISQQSQSQKDLKIRYSDNAAGIDPSKLSIPPGVNPDYSVNELIFQPGVTTKKEGSGYGLYLVRKLLGEHDGSIELVDYRNGVVFDITIPKNAH